MNVMASFLDHARRNGSKLAVIDGQGNNIDFAGLAKRAEHLGNQWTNQGIKPGDRVLLAMPLGIDLYAAIAGLWYIGATIVLPEPALGLKGVKHAVNIAAPTAFLGTGIFRLIGTFLPALRKIKTKLAFKELTHGNAKLFDANKDHPALISFTSGSTGIPKAIVRSQGFLLAQNNCLAPLLSSNNDDERDLVAFPVFVIANLGLGITSVLPNWKLSKQAEANPEIIKQQIFLQKITRVLVPPSICDKLAVITDPPSIRTIFTGGGPVFPDMLSKLTETFPDTDIVSVYGSTEAEPIAHSHVSDLTPMHWQGMREGQGLYVGIPISDISLKIVDNEILVTGLHVNKGYLNGQGDQDNKVKIDGEIWHRTGDAGAVDNDGGIWLWGRHGVTAGEFFPFQIETAARQWPGVKKAALIPNSEPVSLVLEGNEPEQGSWLELARKIGDIKILKLARIPLDKRHQSKIDYPALAELVANNVQRDS